MVLPNIAFDALMFGLLLLAAGLDSVFPTTHGILSLLIVGGTTYWAAQELSDSLLRRVGWTQESLATSVALCAGGFLYFWLRNTSDFALLALSIGLMMGALMVAISVLAAIGSALKEGKITPLFGWVATGVSALALGIAAGVLALVLGLSFTAALPLKLGGIALALVLWKLREKVAPPSVNPHFQEVSAQNVAPALQVAPRVALFPQRGTLLDRLFPLLVLGFLLGALTNNRAQLSLPGSPAVADTSASESGEAR
ncbi:hypothetical protein [Abditibacterium utsteinense]|nr:hypothetical protein [Abditibacterium utsteinense]